MTLNKRITVQRKVKNGTGSFAEEEWQNEFETYANWINVHGSEVWAANSVQAIKAATVTIRYRKDIDEKCRIIYKGVSYEIVSIDNIRERNLFMELKVKAAANG